MRPLRRAAPFFALAFAPAFAAGVRAGEAGSAPAAPVANVRMEDGIRVVKVAGTPEQIGRAYGAALAEPIRAVVRDLVNEGFAREPAAKANILAGSAVMERFQPPEFRAEVRAMAEAAGVDYADLMLAQYFGDVRRSIDGAGASTLCTSFAMLPPLAPPGRALVGRNLDYFDYGVGDYASALVVYRPAGRHAFVTLTWTGLANGWSLLNEKGLFVSNNTVFGLPANRLEGVSTCFLLRKVAENAATVAEAVKIVAESPRSCGTGFLVAQADPPDAAWIEFDARSMTVYPAKDGFVGGANGTIGPLRWPGDPEPGKADEPPPPPPGAVPGVAYAKTPDEYAGRIGAAWRLARAEAGRLAVEGHIAARPGVPIRGMNLHSVTADLAARRLAVSIGGIPACDRAARVFRFEKGELIYEKTLPAPAPDAAAY